MEKKVSDGFTQADYRQLAEFRYLLRKFMVFSESAAAELALTPQQHQVLLAIKGHPAGVSLTTGALAERLCIRHHSAVGLVDRLHKKGLVRRRANVRDRRQVLIELTPNAERLLVRLSIKHRNELQRLAPLLSGLLSSFEGSVPPSS